MRRCLLSALLFSVLCLPGLPVSGAAASGESVPAGKVPDRPARLLETRVWASTLLRAGVAWISDRDVLATALSDAEGPDWKTRVVRVEADSGRVSEVLAEGTLLCANASAGVAGLLVGSNAVMFSPDASGTPPVPRVWSWRAASRSLAESPAGHPFSPWICRATEAGHRALPPARIGSTVYLESAHGILQPESASSGAAGVMLRGAGRAQAVDLRAAELGGPPPFLAFRNEYLIAAGSTLAEAYFRDEQGEAQQESPVVTLSPDGRVRREPWRSRLARLGLVVDAQVQPYARGMLILSPARRLAGGGIYTLDQNRSPRLSRIGCGAGDGEDDRACQLASFALSPDGCRLAFFAAPGPGSAPGRVRLSILDLCGSLAR